MRTHFSKLFWGLLIVFLDLTINGFDWLADGVGYLIVAFGCGGLSVLSPRFVTARLLSLVLTILWLCGFAVSDDFALSYGLATVAVNCAMIWQLLGGIFDFAVARERNDLAGRARNRRIAYVAIMIGGSLLSLELQRSRDVEPLAVIPVVALLVLMIMILHLIRRVKIELAT